jgi:hypothetical protein
MKDGDKKQLRDVLKDLKQELEDGPAKMFVEPVYPTAMFLRRGNPDVREPDFLYRHNERILGLEATAAGYSEEFLRREKLLYACLRKKVSFRDAPRCDYWKRPFDVQLHESIQEALNKKLSLKHYMGFDELIICIYVRATTTPQEKLGELISQLKVPRPNIPGTKVFALCRTHDTPTLGFPIYQLH